PDQRSSKSIRRVPSWAAWATAAAILIALGAGIYGYRVARHGDESQASQPRLPEIAHLQREEHAPAADVSPGPEPTNRDTQTRAKAAPEASGPKTPAPPKTHGALAKSNAKSGTSKPTSAPLVSPTSTEPKMAAANVATTLFVPMREVKQDKHGV